MSRRPAAAILFAVAFGTAVIAFAATNQTFAADARERGQAAGAAPVRLFEGREAGPNELYRFCVLDAGGRLRRCPGP
jgi:hypothetical protein